MAALSTAPSSVGLQFDLDRWHAVRMRLNRLRESSRAVPEITFIVAQRARIAAVADERALRKHIADLTEEAAHARFDLDRQDAAFIERDVAESLLTEVWWSQAGMGLLHQDHVRELAASTITASDALAAGLWSEHDAQILSSMLKRHVRGGPSIVFPYRRPDQRDPEFFRVKRTRGSGRYLQPRRTPTGVFYPPGVLARGDLTDETHPLVVVEGEKKALALDRMGYAVIGLPGIWCAHDKVAKRATGLLRLHPWIREDVKVRGRRVIVAFDTNIRWNREVRRAAKRTAEMFRAAGASDVRIVPWGVKPPPGVNGVDDLAAALGDAAVHDLIGSALPALLPLGIEVPVAVAAADDLTPRQKLVYGALVARAVHGVARRVSLGDLVAAVGGSPQGVGHITRALHAKGWIMRGRGKPKRIRGGDWVREPNSYILLRPTRSAFDVDPADVHHGDLDALLLGVLRHRRSPQTAQKLAQAVGVTPSAVYRSIKSLGARVREVNERYEIV